MIAAARNAASFIVGNPVASNAALMGGMRIFNVALGFITAILLVRGIGVYEFGLFAFSLSIAAIGSVVMRLGLPLLIVREGTAAAAQNDWGAYQRVLRFSTRAGLVLMVALSAIMMIAFAGPTFLAETDYATPGIIGVIVACLMTANALLQARLRGVMKISRAYASEFLIMQGAMLFSIIALTASRSLTLDGAFAALLGAWSLATAASLYWWRRHRPNVPSAAFLRTPWKQYSKTTLSLFCLGLTMLFIGKIETLFLAVFAGPEAVANFAFAFRIASVTSIAGFAVSSRFSPRLSDLQARGRSDALMKEIRSATFVNATASVIIAIAVCAFGWIAIPKVAPELTSARFLTPILATGFVLASFAGRSFDLAAIMGSAKGAVMAAAISLPFFVAMLLVFTPLFGVVGVACATAVVTAFEAALICAIVFRETGLRSDIFVGRTTESALTIPIAAPDTPPHKAEG